jgi:hypothetical protein
MKLEMTITVEFDESNFFNKNIPDEVIYFLETVLVPKNVALKSKLLNRHIGKISSIRDIAEI